MPSSETACATGSPVRNGTCTFGLPVETVIVTVVSLATRSPAPGFWPVTEPTGIVSLERWTTRTRRPWPRIWITALFLVSWPTSGTAIVRFESIWVWILS